MIDSEQDFSRYKLLVAPMLFMFKPGVLERFRSFVEQGGTLVATYFSGYVDENNGCFLGGNPGGAAGRELFGVWSEDFDGLQPTTRQSIVWKGKSYPVTDYAELLHAEGAEVEAVYGDDFYAGTPAVTRKRAGKGNVIYLGARTRHGVPERLLRGFAERIRRRAGAGRPAGDGPGGAAQRGFPAATTFSCTI